MFIFSSSCSALRANKACLLRNLHVTSHFHPAAMAPASVNPSTAKFCFLSGFLEHLPSAKDSENMFQNPWAGRHPGDHVVPASAESWCSSRISSAQVWSVPSPRHLHSNASGSPYPFWSCTSTSKQSPPTPPWSVAGWKAAWGEWAIY